MNKHKTLKQNAKKFRIITAKSPNSPAADSFRKAAISLDLILDSKSQVIQICSAVPGDGKTTVLLNMAISLAEANKKVLLIDMNFEHPCLHRAFNKENNQDLIEYLTNDTLTLEEIVKPSGYKNIDFICSGYAFEKPSTVISLDKTRETIKMLRKHYDVILIDERAMLSGADTLYISKLCDGAIFVISRKHTAKKYARQAVEELNKNGVNILGCIFTEADKYAK
ncbi:MAG: CpsD/CapB family tyrosine-protein kinase [Clostridia bacterium]|nr:CpsD/CapB family tyrosine-protein kinase [Clostridia bacterium]